MRCGRLVTLVEVQQVQELSHLLERLAERHLRRGALVYDEVPILYRVFEHLEQRTCHTVLLMNSGDQWSRSQEGDPTALTPCTAPDQTSEGSFAIDDFAAFARREKLHRVIVVAPANEHQVSYLETLFAQAGRDVPGPFAGWEESIDDWCDDYRAQFSDGSLLEINLNHGRSWVSPVSPSTVWK